MKKLMFAVAAVATMVAVAETPVASQIVGFQKFNLDTESGRQFTMVATQFAPLNETGKWYFSNKAFDKNLEEGDCVYFFDKNLEDRVYYYFLGFDGETAQWLKMWTDGLTGEPLEDDTLTGIEVTKSETLYWQPSDGKSSIDCAGGVENPDESVKVNFPDSAPYNLVNPYPVDTTLAELESFFIEGDNLYIFDEELEDRVYYYYLGDHVWLKMWTDGLTGEPLEDDTIPNTFVILKAGQGGVFNASDDDGREWIVSLKK